VSPARGPRHRVAAAAVALVALALVARAVAGDFLGATALLVVACGLAVVPYLPAELDRLSVWCSVVPSLGLASFAAVLTTASILGIRLDGVSIPLAVAAFVVPVALGSTRLPSRPRGSPAPLRRELLALLALGAIVAFALASSWDIAYPFQARGTDWGHYLLYADEVATQGDLLIDDPLAGEPDRVFADPPAVGALYGSLLLLDGVSSWSLTAGLVVLAALTVMSVYAAAAALWGSGAGLVAAGTYAVAPIRLDPAYWHGLGTVVGMLFLPLVLLSLALLFRGVRGRRVVLLLAVALLGVATAHSTSAVVVGVLVVVAPLLDLVVRMIGGRRELRPAVRGWWREGVLRPLALAVGIACVLGAGIVTHLALQARALGRPVDYRFLDPGWFDRAAVEHYFGATFLVVAVAAVALVLSSARLRHDAAMLALASLLVACVAVSQLWRVHVSFDYQRVVYYVGVGLALLVGAAFARRSARVLWIGVFVLALVVVARSSVGLRLPERVLRSEPRDAAVSGLQSFREQLDGGALPATQRLVTDGCLHFAVPYLVRRPTMPAFGERQVGFVDRLPLARQAAAILAGGPGSASLAGRLGVRYAVADPECEPELAKRLHGTTVLANEGVVVVRLPAPR
jgi:hypothetical protein